MTGVEDPETRLSLFGAAPDTGNLGVSALLHSVLAAIADHERDIDVTVFDNRLGSGLESLQSSGGSLEYERLGIRRSRRLHRWESNFRYRVASRWPASRHPGVTRLRSSVAALDISGGDSFSDIYGPTRLDAVLASKELALRLGVPLVLLPQTYGPFSSPGAVRKARRVLAGASQVWARDEASLAVAAEILGPHAAGRLRLGVDVAFGLPIVPRPPNGAQGPGIAMNDRPTVGLNVSGLVAEDPERFGLRLDYPLLMRQLVTALVATGTRVLLIPHVGVLPGGHESDRSACDALMQVLPEHTAPAVTVAEGYSTPATAKWLISQLDWFCGTRMHATIAGLSSEVPTTAIAYSDKTAGVFATCGVEDQVVDARRSSTSTALEQLLAAFDDREAMSQRLAESVPPVRERARSQITEILDGVSDLREDHAADHGSCGQLTIDESGRSTSGP